MSMDFQAKAKEFEEQYGRPFIVKNGIIHDSVEYTERFLSVIADVQKHVEDELNKQGLSSKTMGVCFLYWQITQRILKEQYGIDWRSPGELNRHIKFD